MTQRNLDTICRKVRKPEMLNALHACRADHPLNKLTPMPWTNAVYLAHQQPSYVISDADIRWLEQQAAAHGEFDAKRGEYAAALSRAS